MTVERSFSEVELVMVGVVYACRRFRHYLLPWPFLFLTSYSFLPQLINGSNLSKIVMKWVIELHEFSFSFLVEESTRAILANLLTYKKIPVLIKEAIIQKPKEDTKDMDKAFILFFDGSYRKTHDAASRGIVLYDLQGVMITKKGVKLDAHSNNEAEYLALEVGILLCLEYGVKQLQIKGDAFLLVKHVLGVWQTKNTKLRSLCSRIKSLLKRMEAWGINQISRELNEEAHMAAQTMSTQVFVIKSNESMYLGRETLSKEEKFLLTGTFSRGVRFLKRICFHPEGPEVQAYR